jgi:hypothetical protein
MAISEARLKELLKAPEDALLERKPGTVNRDEIRRTVVAFANSVQNGQEAILLIGVDDRGNVLGVENTDTKQKEVRRVCAEDCYPEIAHQSQVFVIEGKPLVIVTVPPSRRRPHFAGPAYVRRGSESIAATAEVYEDLINSRVDKCRVLQTWRGATITYIEDRYRLQHGRVPGEWRASGECRIESSDAHRVRIQELGSQAFYTLRLEQVEIGYDEQKHRNSITVHP